MAILKKEEFLSKLHDKFGADNSEESINFVEDMVDTYNDLETRTKGDGIDWKKKYEENDAAWLKRYQHRFFSGIMYCKIYRQRPRHRLCRRQR